MFEKYIEAWLATIFLVLLWNWPAWKLFRKFIRRAPVISAFLISLFSFMGFFATTIYISHGRVMTFPEGASVGFGLLFLNAILIARYFRKS